MGRKLPLVSTFSSFLSSVLAYFLNICCFTTENLSSVLTCILNINIFRTLRLPFLLSYHYSHSFLSSLQEFLHQSIFSMLLSLRNSSNTPLHFSNAFPGTVCVLVFQIFLSFPKDYKSINQAANSCFLQISIKKAPYFQQKLYHIDSWTPTCPLSPKTTEVHHLFKVIDNWLLPRFCLHLI